MSNLTFEVPSKKIFDQSDLPNFRRSVAYHKLQGVLRRVIEKIKSVEVPPQTLDLALVTRKQASSSATKSNLSGPETLPTTIVEPSIEHPQDNFHGVLSILRTFNQYIDETPPLKGPRRFGNLACREWHDKIIRDGGKLISQNIKVPDSIIKENGESYITEVKYYLLNSFGSQVRLDYGTGHELSFLAFLGSLFDLGIFDYDQISGQQILILFVKYYDLVRRLILEYSLEPAGSHGVWGLDDHFHLIYILGAAQFNTSAGTIAPPVSQVLTSQTINTYKGSNLYVNAIAFIFRIKSGPFNEHSPIIYDIHSSVHLWTKVLQGLLKMYEVEVLGKFPVVQHFWFGNVLYPWKDVETNRDLPVNPRSDANEDNDEVGFINGSRGVNTTTTNISMTGAPWAMKNAPTARPRR